MQPICTCANNNGKYFAIAVIIVLVSCYCTEGASYRKTKRDTAYSDDDDDSLFITVSSTKKSQIELNWNFSHIVPNQIRLYNSDPREGSHPIAWIDNDYRKGFYITKQTLNLDVLPNGWDSENNFNQNIKPPKKGAYCLNYWIAAFKNNRLIKKACLKIQPTWMKDNGDKIGNIPLGKLMIPGTHNSGCYDDFPESDVRVKSIDKFLYTQDRDVWTQLCFGIRYLDVRIGYYNSTNTFWVNHDKFQVTPLKDLLRVLKLFSNKAEDEIIILDLHRFPVGFKNRARHRQLMDLLHAEIGDIAIPRTFQKSPHGPTLNELWKQKRRIIIAYGDKTSAINSDYLWDPLNQQWGNKQTTSSLKNYLEEIRSVHETKSNNPFWAAMAELTPTTATVILGFISNASLTQMADSVNRNLTTWYKYEWCDTNNNIIATDFFMGNDMINVCIYCNLKNAKNWN